MKSELDLKDEVAEQLTAVVQNLIAIAPRRSKCIFLNLEFRDSESDTAISPDLFVVLKPLFGKVKRTSLDVDWTTTDLLMALGGQMLEHGKTTHVIIDLIIKEDGHCIAYRDDGPLRRLGGGDAMYRSKYWDYLDCDPWLAELNKVTGRI